MGAFILIESKQNCDITATEKKNGISSTEQFFSVKTTILHHCAGLIFYRFLQERSVWVKTVSKSAVVQNPERWLNAQIKLKLTKRLHPISPWEVHGQTDSLNSSFTEREREKLHLLCVCIGLVILLHLEKNRWATSAPCWWCYESQRNNKSTQKCYLNLIVFYSP